MDNMGRKVKIRAYTSDDADIILGWVDNERIFRRFTFDRFDKYPITSKEFDDYYKKISEYSKVHPLILVDEETSESVGHICLTVLDGDTVRLGMVVVDSEKRGFGYGRLLIEEAIKYANTKLMARNITIGVFEDNIPARKTYDSIGFREDKLSQKKEYSFLGEKWCLLELKLTGDKK